jgi:hypothetical protein
MSSYKFEPEYCPENGFWYCEKLVYMSLPECYGEFDKEEDCKGACYVLNELFDYLFILKNNYNINLRLTEVKRD